MNTDPIWQHSQAEGSDFWVLMAIAHDLGDAAEATLYVRDLAKTSRTSMRTVQRALGRLCDLGELQVTYGVGREKPSRYRVLIGQEPKRAEETGPPGRRDILTPFRGDRESSSTDPPTWRRLLGVPNNGNGAA